ncbi:unnamed protein product [Blepharisma stoltei]|uniref:Major facilitator superfamily (MFS) profile domain-containing protein n=1 Tax=Blepharisma stoltei TaxID=1481888 RepID=A0AAU9J0C9_9CILI|nr:unnamed protein product [Blepharisma stoltei]
MILATRIILLILITATTFGSYSAQNALPVIGERLDADIIAILTVTSVFSLVLAPFLSNFLTKFQERNMILCSLLLSLGGIMVFAFVEMFSGFWFYFLAVLSMLAVSGGAIGYLIPAIIVIFHEAAESGLKYFPFIEFSWDLGYTFGGIMPLFVDEDVYFHYYFTPIGCAIFIGFVYAWINVKEVPKDAILNEGMKIYNIIIEKEIFMDALIITYVVAACKCVDPVMTGLVEDLDGNESDATFFIITGTSVSFVVTSSLVFTLEFLERRFVMIFGIICCMIGLTIVGPINFAVGGSKNLLRISIVFLDFGMQVGTAAGLPTLYHTVKYRLKWRVDQKLINLLIGIWVTAILLGHIAGPSVMIWLTLKYEYYKVTVVFFLIGVMVAIVYTYLYRDTMQVSVLLRGSDDEDLIERKSGNEEDFLIKEDKKNETESG